MGAVDLIPGVSSGTVAFLFGIYDELLYTIKLLTGRVPRLLLAGKFSEAFRLIPLSFILPLGIGVLLAIFGLVHVITFLLESQPMLVWAFFFGLVVGSSYIISRRITTWTVKRALLLALGFGVTFLLIGLPAATGSDAPFAIIGTGAIAITAMILPGISGSLIMVLLGQYEIIINAVADRNFLTLGLFFLGALCGIALFVRLLTWLLQHYHLAVMALLIGVMAGSLRRIWPWQTTDADGHAANILPTLDLSLLWVILLMILGFVTVMILEKIGVAKEHDDINTAEFQDEIAPATSHKS